MVGSFGVRCLSINYSRIAIIGQILLFVGHALHDKDEPLLAEQFLKLEIWVVPHACLSVLNHHIKLLFAV
jgi:hypothetical protein